MSRKDAPKKTNAVRLLDTLSIRYELRTYEVDAEDLSAANVASKIGIPLEQAFKTLVVRGDRAGICLAVVPGDAALALGTLAKLTGNKSMRMVSVSELLDLTGYMRGGVTALACKHEYPVFVDETVELFDTISVSAGVRGMQILLAPADYLRAVNGQLANLSV